MRDSFPFLLVLVAYSASSFAATDQPRTLHFPAESVGQIDIRPVELGDFVYSRAGTQFFEGWKPLGPAAGEVAIPADHLVRWELLPGKRIELAWLDDWPVDALDAVEAAYLPLTDEDARHITRLTGLKSLNLSGTEITTALAADLGRLRGLQRLVLGGEQLENAVLAELARLPHLQSLFIHSSGFTDQGIAQLTQCRSLRAFYCSNTAITDAGVAALCQLPELQAIYLYAGDPEFRSDDPCPVVTDKAIPAFCSQPKLEFLNLTGAAITDRGLAELASGLPNLRGIVLDFTPITADGLQHLAQCPKLEQLAVRGVSLGSEIAYLLAPLKNLRQFNGDFRLSDAALAELASLEKLEELDLEGKGITDASVALLAAMPALRNLQLQDTSITDEGLASVSGWPALERIQLTRNEITTRCVETLAKMPRLNRVGLMDIAPRVDGEPIWKGLDGLNRLEEELWFAFCPPLSAEDFKAFANFTRLKQFRIEGTKFGMPGRALTEADIQQLSSLSQLEYLELADLVVLETALPLLARLPRLKRLRINCSAGDDALQSLAAYPALEYLSIASPQVTQDGVQRLQAANPNIRSVEVEEFRIATRPVSKSPHDNFWRNGTLEERTELSGLESDPAPPLVVTDWLNADDGTTLGDFRGKVVLLDFWGRWCGPCVAELPEIRRLRDKYADQGLVVIGVHSTEAADAAQEFVDENNLDWPTALDDQNQTKSAYALQAWPTTYLVDRQGRLRMAGISATDREAAIQALLAE